MAVVLVVDDEADLRDLVALRIRAMGHVVHTASGVVEAETLVAGLTGLDLAVLDINMDDGDGRDLLVRLRSTRPDLAAVLVTGMMGASSAAAGLGAAYLAKPFSGAQLRAVVGDQLTAAGP